MSHDRAFRLVFPDQACSLREVETRREIADANRAAADFAATVEPEDLRAEFARWAARGLEGGRAAILRPAKRRELVDAAGRVGIRPFEANLIIALVQDRARHGELVQTIEEAQALVDLPSRQTVPGAAWEPDRPAGARPWLWSLLAGVIGGAVFCIALASWVLHGR